MKLILFCIFIFSLIFNINSLNIIFDNSNDCSKELCNFNNETLWIGGVVPSSNDTAIIDYSNSTLNGDGNLNIQIINIPENITVDLVSLNITGPQIQFNLYGNLQLSYSLTLSNSNFSVSTDQENSSSQLSNVYLDDSILVINSTQSETYFLIVNGTVLSQVSLIQSSNFSAQTTDNTTLFQVGSLFLDVLTRITLTGIIDVQEVQSLGQILLVEGCSLSFGPSKDGVSEIYSIFGIFSTASELDFYDDSVINNLEINQMYDNSYSQITFYQGIQINNSPIINNTVINIPKGSFLQENTTLNLGQNGGLILLGEAVITNDISVGDVGISVKSDGTLLSSAITITGDIMIYQGTLNANSTTFIGDVYQTSGEIDILIFANITGNFIQNQADSILTFTNILTNQTTPSLTIAGVATLTGSLQISIKDDFKGDFEALLISAAKIQGNFTKYDILTFGSNKNPIFTVKNSTNSKTQELWLSFSQVSDTPKQKLPSWQIALIVIGALSSIFLLFLLIITLFKFIKRRSNPGYTPIGE